MAVSLLPTPAVNDMGKAYTPDEWDEWTAKMKAAHGNGNGHGKSLEIEAARMVNGDGYASADNRPDPVLHGVRGATGAKAVRRTTGGSDPLPVAQDVLANVREQPPISPGGQSPLARTSGSQADEMRDVRGDDGASRAPQGSERGEQRPIEPDRTVRELSPTPPLERGSGRSHGVHFGAYEAAVQRWEAVLGRESPAPTEPTGRDGAHRLSAKFTEFLMGWPEGHVTSPDIGLTRNEQLKICGNGVVPQQAEAALHHLLAMRAAYAEVA